MTCFNLEQDSSNVGAYLTTSTCTSKCLSERQKQLIIYPAIQVQCPVIMFPLLSITVHAS